jgi:hypothetical protein
MKKIIPLPDRCFIEISGDDRKKFLQGLITNDINLASENNLIYSAMLNAQGRFLYDFFIFENNAKLYLDCHQARCNEIIKKLNFYKLRSKVEVKKNTELFVAQSFEGLSIATSEDYFIFVDPRHNLLGQRFYYSKIVAENFSIEEEAFYHFIRISNKIAEGEYDLTCEKSFILEFGFNEITAINYQKGCYVGQELTARTHYRGEIRKKIFYIKISTKNTMENVIKNSGIYLEEREVGIILSSVFYNNELHALALIRIPEDQEDKNFYENLKFQKQKISIIS